MATPDLFGGEWTREKLELVRKYLSAYAQIFKDRDFTYGYIDAFAGSGYCSVGTEKSKQEPLFHEFEEPETQEFLEGSARVALQVEPEYQKYVFIEKDAEAVEALHELKIHFPDKADRIEIVHGEANTWLVDRCTSYHWRDHRAVVFLDPYGMQVEWNTIEAIAGTGAIDLWVLFPLGIATNRLLVGSGRIPEGWKKRLDLIFGTEEWEEVFYEKHPTLTGGTKPVKTINLEGIGDYYNERLKSVFPHVAENPRMLYNTTGNPLYMLCFAANVPVAVKIAEDILDS